MVQRVVMGCLEKGVLGFWFLSCPEAFRVAPPLVIHQTEVDVASGHVLDQFR